MERSITLSEVIKTAIEALHRNSLYHCVPGKVQAVHAGQGTVDVQIGPLTSASTSTRGPSWSEPWPLLQNVPVGYLKMGGLVVYADMAVGDVVRLLGRGPRPDCLHHERQPERTRRTLAATSGRTGLPSGGTSRPPELLPATNGTCAIPRREAQPHGRRGARRARSTRPSRLHRVGLQQSYAPGRGAGLLAAPLSIAPPAPAPSCRPRAPSPKPDRQDLLTPIRTLVPATFCTLQARISRSRSPSRPILSPSRPIHPTTR